MLHGRGDQIQTLDAVLDAVRSDRGRTLVLRGEAGVGKSALLEHVARQAGDALVLRGAGVESETELPFSGLHLLFGGFPDRVGELPPPQADALSAALGGAPGTDEDAFLVGAAVLTLLAELAEERPVVCLVDDASWLDGDSARALLFAARRLAADPVALLFTARQPLAPPFPAPGVPELWVPPLAPEDARLLLREHAGDLEPHVRDELVTQAGGNPLALRELADAHRAGQLTGHPLEIAHPRVLGRLQRTFADRLTDLPTATRALLLLTAAESTGDPEAVLAAARRSGAEVADLEPAERRGLVRSVAGRIEFTHPLIRSVVYQQASLRERLAAHTELARAHADQRHRCPYAWHRAAATTAPDESVAADLTAAAEADRGPGGLSSAASAYERAAWLSPRPAARGRRLLAAAQTAAGAGQRRRAGRLADEAARHLTDPTRRAAAALVRAGGLSDEGRPREAHQLLVDAGRTVAPHDAHTAGQLLFQAVEAAWQADDFTAVTSTARQAAAAGLPDSGLSPTRLARAAGGLNGRPPGGTPDGVRATRELIAAARDAAGADCGPVVARWHLLLGDHREAHRAALSAERAWRARGAVGSLLPVLHVLARTHRHLGELPDAVAAGTEALRLAEELDQPHTARETSAALAHQAALVGDEDRCAALAAVAAEARTGDVPVRAGRALGLLDLGLGRYEAALERLAPLLAGTNRMAALPATPDLTEAAVRTGQPERAHEAVARYADWAELVDQPWARGVAQRCRALLAAGDEQHASGAGELFRSALEWGSGDDLRPFEQARTQLSLGEWLRRDRQRAAARPLLRAAAATFTRLGAGPWARRARAELRATGETVPDRSDARAVDPVAVLTPQELHVVRLAAEGLSNRDIGARLFLSPRTVGYYLYKAFPKLGVASRTELARAVPPPRAQPS